MGADISRRHKLWIKILGVCLGMLGILGTLYPVISNYVFEHRADSQVQSYERAAEELGASRKAELLEMAQAYNDSLTKNRVRFTDPLGEKSDLVELENAVRFFADQLSLEGTGVIATVEVPKIEVKLPVYADDSYEQALERGTVLVTGTSIPVGGTGSHAVISGHTGLHSAKIFTDLTSLEEGDLFFISILGDQLAYQVDQIQVVDPQDVTALAIDAEEDYCTLLTCTPYGVNSHRLLVRGVRVIYSQEDIVQLQTEVLPPISQWWEEYYRALLAGISFVMAATGLFFIKRMIHYAKRKKRKNRTSMEKKHSP